MPYWLNSLQATTVHLTSKIVWVNLDTLGKVKITFQSHGIKLFHHFLKMQNSQLMEDLFEVLLDLSPVGQVFHIPQQDQKFHNLLLLYNQNSRF